MTDKELLELAAKAAGYRINGSVSGEPWISANKGRSWQGWNPLTDDGDALRLAVKLGLSIDQLSMLAVAGNFRTTPVLNYVENKGDDPYAATRRAIVRAAAEIGRAM